MNFKEILELIDIVAERGVAEIEIEQAGTKLRIQGKPSAPQVIHSYMNGQRDMPLPALSAPSASVPVLSAKAQEDETDASLHVITSPIVGTFYKSPSPTSEPFVSIGDFVEKGTVVCIVEAMKLMNEIESDVSGEIVSILIDSGQPVEYGEALFGIRPV